MTYGKLNELSKEQGDCFYILDSSAFVDNYYNLLNAFRNYYDDTEIAYSYKTNYLPCLCKIVNENGGCAEIVSEMEWWLTQKIDVTPQKVYYNGPYKKYEFFKEILLKGGNINLDSEYEIDFLKKLANKYPQNIFKVGIRCCADIGQEVSSRFGFDINSGALKNAIEKINAINNISVCGLHIHLPYRDLDSFQKRVLKLEEILRDYPDYKWKYISMGGGYMGRIDETLSKEFDFIPPTYNDYAKIVAGAIKEMFPDKDNYPKLIIEPGSALVADTMKLVTRVVDIKKSRDRYIATLTGSTYNMNPSVKNVRRTIKVYSDENNCIAKEGEVLSTNISETDKYENLDMAGYTCIEGDYLYKGYSGNLKRGDFVVFNNVGSYSIVMKPPFILPDVAVVDMAEDFKAQKKIQTVDRIFEDAVI